VRFIERTYAEFFGTMVPGGRDPRELSEWIGPRLDIVRWSIVQTPLSTELTGAIRDGLDRLGLLRGTQTVGCFVRSDTNVEDLDSFNGAGLNLTIFNMGSLDDIYTALKEVWASPFELRSFSWRQTLIDQPLWVLPSVVILESVPSEKSGVLVTCDIDTGDRTKMVIATSEGVGGAVDGTSAETLLWSQNGVELLTLYKSAWKNALLPGGGRRVVPSSGKDEVLSPAEVAELVAAGKAIDQKLAPALDAHGRPRPWDIEFGFSGGKLWLFQSRPFIGNESVKNVPVLAALDPASTATAKDRLSLGEVLR
jgi:phosphoenolpyruvate synthase/pyruvate phosphate dikinase